MLYGGGDDKHCVEKLDPSNDVNDPEEFFSFMWEKQGKQPWAGED